MRPPRTRRARSVNPSRFQEGSMNDRTSNAPPVHFLGPDEREQLERPVTRSQSRPVSDDWADKQVKKGRLGHVWEEVRGRLGFRREEDDRGSRKRDRSRKGEKEDGRHERSRLRSRSRGRDRSQSRSREKEEREERQREREIAKAKEEKNRNERLKEEAPKTDMPSREEILANYHNLVAAGFFTSHAIQSTRQPPPGAPVSGSATPSSKATPKPQIPSRSATPQPPPGATINRSATPLSKVTPKPEANGLSASRVPGRSTTPQPQVNDLSASRVPSRSTTPQPQASNLSASRAPGRSTTPQPPPVALFNGSAAPSSKMTPKSQANKMSAPRAPNRSTTPQPPPPRAPSPFARPSSSHAKSPSSPKNWEPRAATYDQLVASGFFSPPAPPTAVHPLFRKASPGPAAEAPAPVGYSTRTSRDYLQPPTPHWTSRAGSPAPSRVPSPALTLGSVSSRGTKRNAIEIPTDDEDEENNAHDPPTPKKRLRKTASRDIAAPKPANAAPRRAMAPRRSVSVSGINNVGRESNNLARRVLGRLPGANSRNNGGTPDQQRPALRRSASGGSKHPSESPYSRVLRSRRSAKDALKNAKVPQVPGIPHKFVSCEDRENGAPYLTLHL